MEIQIWYANFLHIRSDSVCLFFPQFLFDSPLLFCLTCTKIVLLGPWHGMADIYVHIDFTGMFLLTFLIANRHIVAETNDLFSADDWKIERVTDERIVISWCMKKGKHLVGFSLRYSSRFIQLAKSKFKIIYLWGFFEFG